MFAVLTRCKNIHIIELRKPESTKCSLADFSPCFLEIILDSINKANYFYKDKRLGTFAYIFYITNYILVNINCFPENKLWSVNTRLFCVWLIIPTCSNVLT